MQALVVDDSRAMRAILKRLLGQIGFEAVEEAENGKAALERLEGGLTPDVALLDWNMPEMNGLELVRAIRSRGELASLPLMMVTTETEVHQVEAALMAGANEYIMKPFTQDALAAKLALLGLTAG